MTMTSRGLADGRAVELRGQRVPFVAATVVRAERPTSAKAGDTAIVLSDGTIEGFVGGACAETSVRAQALSSLANRTSVLLRIVPDSETDRSDPVGQITVANPCLSGGTLEIFLEPIVPPSLIFTIGTSPIALALGRGAAMFGFDLRLIDALPDPLPDDTTAVVVASHGRGEEAALLMALDSAVPYIALVASNQRGKAVIESLGVRPEVTDRIHTPAGLDIGARTPEEVALSILAQIISEQPRELLSEVADAMKPVAHAKPRTVALDPVCGMTVAAVPASLHLGHKGKTVYFCGSGCQLAFTASPESYLPAAQV